MSIVPETHQLGEFLPYFSRLKFVSLEMITTDLDKLQKRIVRKELNFDFGQFFYPQEKRKIFETRYFCSEIEAELGNKNLVEAVVLPHPRLGTLTTFDERVFYVLIEMWSQQGKPAKTYFSEREIVRRLGVNWGRDTAKAVDNALYRLRGVIIEWKGSFFSKKDQQYITIKNPFNILSHLEILSTKDRHISRQLGTFTLNDRVIENLDSLHSRPLHLDTVLSFKSPLAQALYIHVDRLLYYSNHYHRKTSKLLLEDLQLLGKRYRYPSNRRDELIKVRAELLGKPTSGKEPYFIDDFTLEKGTDDYILHISRTGNCRRKNGKTIAIPAVKPDLNPSATKNQTQRSPATSEARQLIELFHQTYGRPSGTQLKTDLKTATQIIAEYGKQQAIDLVRQSKMKAQKTNYNPQSLKGIENILRELHQEQQQRKQRQEKEILEEQTRRDEEKAKKNKTIQEEVKKQKLFLYRQQIAEQFPAHYEQFERALAKKVEVELNQHESVARKPQLLEIWKKWYSRDEYIAKELDCFASQNAELNLPNFAQWNALLGS